MIKKIAKQVVPENKLGKKVTESKIVAKSDLVKVLREKSRVTGKNTSNGKNVEESLIDKLEKKVKEWESKKKSSAWEKIDRHSIAYGLSVILNAYKNVEIYKISPYYTRIQQGSYPMCGPAAIMYGLLKKDLESFVNTILELNEVGKIKGWQVPSKLRAYDANPDKYFEGGKYNEYEWSLSRVWWMFQASLSQKESNVLNISPDKTDFYNDLSMHTRSDEMKKFIKTIIVPSKIDEQTDWSWKGTHKKSNENVCSHIKKWKECIDKLGFVFWLMHSNMLDGKRFTHLKISDLHWVVVLNVELKGNDVEISLHTWGEIRKEKMSLSDFRKTGCHSFTIS